MRRLRLRHFAFAPLLIAIACTPSAPERVATARGTVGQEVYGVFCDRIGAQALTEDLDGSSYHDICHPAADGTYASTVDDSKLPPIDSTVTVADGGAPANLDTVRAERALHEGRLLALARRRTDVIRALDAAFPDVVLPTIADINNPDAAQSCNPIDASTAGKDANLTHQLSDMLGRLQALYNDGTLPRTTEALGRLMNNLENAPDGQVALTHLGARLGYRPSNLSLGIIKPAVAYSGLRDLSNASLSLLSADSQPYALNPPVDANGNRIPVPGAAEPQFAQLLATAYQELRTYTPDDLGLGPLTQSTDAQSGYVQLSRPRTNLEFLTYLITAQDPAFTSSSTPLYMYPFDQHRS